MSRKRPRVAPMFGARRDVLFVLPPIDDDLDAETKDALAIRNACSVAGRCPDCGTVGVVAADPTIAGLNHVTFHHRDGCGALTNEEAAP